VRPLARPARARFVGFGDCRELKARSPRQIVEEGFVDPQPPAVDGDHIRKSQALRREMNEQLRRLSHPDGEAGTLRLLCECGRCNDQVVLAADSYGQASAIPGRPLVKPGHDTNGDAPSEADRESVAGWEAA
jgi:hypothetical protein